MDLGSFLAKLAFLLSPILRLDGIDQSCIRNESLPPAAPPFTILVEGNVGSGKSTLLRQFDGSPSEVLVVPEPVGQWQNVSGTDLLMKVEQ